MSNRSRQWQWPSRVADGSQRSRRTAMIMQQTYGTTRKISQTNGVCPSNRLAKLYRKRENAWGLARTGINPLTPSGCTNGVTYGSCQTDCMSLLRMHPQRQDNLYFYTRKGYHSDYLLVEPQFRSCSLAVTQSLSRTGLEGRVGSYAYRAFRKI